ncbi:alpha/beta fold hydrolase [Rhodococcus sp. WS4]|nr:alpha/beta fold hydrolase [Rhodococcus sp. WS4]
MAGASPVNQPIRNVAVPTTVGPLSVQDAGPTGAPVALLWPSLFSDGRTSWGGQLAGLHALGWRTLLIDPPGAGRSLPASQPFTMEDCARAAVDILDAAAVDRAAVLGLSWGGFVGLRVALARPDRVSGLVLSNTSARRTSPALRARDLFFSGVIRLGLPGGPGKLIVSGMLSEHSRRTNPELVADVANTVNAMDARGLAVAVRSVLVDRTSVVDDLSKITVPALVIAGAEDRALPNPHSTELAEGIHGARLEVVPRVAHLAPREAPDVVSTLLRDFLPLLESRRS